MTQEIFSSIYIFLFIASIVTITISYNIDLPSAFVKGLSVLGVIFIVSFIIMWLYIHIYSLIQPMIN